MRLGTRASLLARTQSATVGDAWAKATGGEWQEVLITTAGDDTSVPLSQPGQPGVFVSALRAALLGSSAVANGVAGAAAGKAAPLAAIAGGENSAPGAAGAAARPRRGLRLRVE